MTGEEQEFLEDYLSRLDPPVPAGPGEGRHQPGRGRGSVQSRPGAAGQTGGAPAVIEASVVAGDQDFQRADRRADILSRALRNGSHAPVEAGVIADTLQPGLDPQIHEARYIILSFRREEYQAALDAVNAATELLATSKKTHLRSPRAR